MAVLKLLCLVEELENIAYGATLGEVWKDKKSLIVAESPSKRIYNLSPKDYLPNDLTVPTFCPEKYNLIQTSN